MVPSSLESRTRNWQWLRNQQRGICLTGPTVIEGEVDATIPLTEATREPVAIAVIDNQIYVLGSRQHQVEFFSPAGTARRVAVGRPAISNNVCF